MAGKVRVRSFASRVKVDQEPETAKNAGGTMWYLVLRRPVKPREAWTVGLDQHLLWMKRQHETGKILFSGPTTDRKLGIYVIKADSKEEAERLAGSDPYTAAGFCAFDLYEWEVHQILGAGPFTAAELRAHK